MLAAATAVVEKDEESLAASSVNEDGADTDKDEADSIEEELADGGRSASTSDGVESSFSDSRKSAATALECARCFSAFSRISLAALASLAALSAGIR
jgi:hypothetical protein